MNTQATLFLALVLGCGGSTPAAETPSSEGAAPATNTSGVRARADDEIPRPPAPWAEMDHAARSGFMASQVVPYMSELFQEYDSEEYASFGCVDCHGAGAAARDFAMPSPDLLALHPSGSPEQQAMVQEHPRMVRFMFNHVVPAMKTMLGAEDYNEETGEGFSCYTCHPSAADDVEATL